MSDNKMENLTVGTEVHFVHGDGTHAKATIAHVHNQEGVVDLQVTRDDGPETYARKTVVMSAEPKAYTWHFITEACSKPAEPDR